MKIYIIMICVVLFIYIQKNNMVWVQSSFNNKQYLIKKTDNVALNVKKATILSKIENRANLLIQSLPNDKRKTLLLSKSIQFQERSSSHDVGYTINKGDKIGLCIENDINTLMFICIHELAHVCTKEIGHTKLFWENFKYILEAAIKSDIYDYRNYNINPKMYCKTNINFTPVK